MNLPKFLTTVTSFSKILAAILFISLPFIGYFIGVRYQEMLNLAKSQQEENNVSIARVPTPTPIAIPTIDPSITANWKTYEGVYPIRFSYPENLKLSEGDADIGSIIRLWSPLGEDKDSEFQIRIPLDLSSAQEVIQKLEEAGFTIEKEFQIDGFLATQLKGTSTPNTFIAPRMTTKVVVQANGKIYEITDWRSAENASTFNQILATFKFTN